MADKDKESALAQAIRARAMMDEAARRMILDPQSRLEAAAEQVNRRFLRGPLPIGERGAIRGRPTAIRVPGPPTVSMGSSAVLGGPAERPSPNPGMLVQPLRDVPGLGLRVELPLRDNPRALRKLHETPKVFPRGDARGRLVTPKDESRLRSPEDAKMRRLEKLILELDEEQRVRLKERLI